LSGNFNKFVTLAKHKTPWRWCRCIETCKSTSIYRILLIYYVVHWLVGIIKAYKMHGMYIKIKKKLTCLVHRGVFRSHGEKISYLV